MKREFKLGGYLLAVIIVLVVTIIIGNKATMQVPAFLLFGLIFVDFLVHMDEFIEIARGRSPVIETNLGKWSINAGKDIIPIPWHSNIVKGVNEKNQIFGEMVMIRCGGIDAFDLSIKGAAHDPKIICPKYHLEKIGNSYRVKTALKLIKNNQLSSYLRYIVDSMGIKDKTNYIYLYGNSSYEDGTATSENLGIEFEELKENETISSLEDKLEIYRRMHREDKKDKMPAFIKEKITPATEE